MENITTPQRSAKEQFDRQAGHYDSQWNLWSEESLRWLLENAEPQPTDRALDIATGTGFTALAFAPHVAQVVGLDVSPGMLAQARKQAAEQGIANADFQEGEAEHMPFPDDSFDLVTCRIAPHHFLSIKKFLREVARVLKPGGRLLLADTSVPDNDPEADHWQNTVEVLRDLSHVRNYTPAEWRAFLTEAGLTIEATNDSGGIPITLNDWLKKAGCTPEQSFAVRMEFAAATPAITETYQIEFLPDNDIAFVWRRFAAKATMNT
jgi:ubiquinone/menaquinone biosynthesis C-methylase UbiE